MCKYYYSPNTKYLKKRQYTRVNYPELDFLIALKDRCEITGKELEIPQLEKLKTGARPPKTWLNILEKCGDYLNTNRETNLRIQAYHFKGTSKNNKKCLNNKSGGTDGIKYEALKKLPVQS
ncbi:hypothetical protein PR048_026738 [Dryococelus australis]|uniref:Uncharacterized protein n=1 Tax=Dryococelus australis TaxID=614101 RepID=A0ABQ9GM68_9NEOP|nr:hypothetical protein PR048_026738 [Dryococelus australis]